MIFHDRALHGPPPRPASRSVHGHPAGPPAAAALQWCQHASDFTASVGGKPWKYLLIPHDEVNESRRLDDFLRFGPKS